MALKLRFLMFFEILLFSSVFLASKGCFTPAIAKIQPTPNPKVARLESLLHQYKSPKPYSMARALSSTPRVNLYTSLAIEESNANPLAIGDNGQSIGAFQIQPKHHGPVHLTPILQTAKAVRILEDLIKMNHGKLRPALAQYNGGPRPPPSSYRYADRILRRAAIIRNRLA